MNTKSIIGKIIRIGFIVGTLTCVIGFTQVATAANGCGWGSHRNYHGRCVSNYYYNYHHHNRHCWTGHWGRLHCNY